MASSRVNKRRQLSGVPTIWPIRAIATDTNGSRGTHFSTIERTMRGGSRSNSKAAPIIMPSKGSWPEWLAMIRTRPCSGTFSTPKVWTRK
jgi:hypothetical protein